MTDLGPLIAVPLKATCINLLTNRTAFVLRSDFRFMKCLVNDFTLVMTHRSNEHRALDLPLEGDLGDSS